MRCLHFGLLPDPDLGHTAAWLIERSINLDETLLRPIENAVITESIFNG
jgi:hypothetical protein